ncbi:hypothetical protein [Haladaptatus caseinilyticus]|uniref:hypothetical protein n=1 Tax=Haladaptatus caseinilyticus TaxID=2993314 RepID=UPI00224B5FB8|nr:hypothetical protein [Haladaptatus caseinilyticus]
MFDTNDVRVLSDGGTNDDTRADDGTMTNDSTKANDDADDFRFRLGGLSLDLSGVKADIDGLTLGLDAIELDVPRSGGSKSVRSRQSSSHGAQVGAFVGRMIGGLIGRIVGRVLRLLWDGIRSRVVRSKRGDESSEAGESNEESDSSVSGERRSDPEEELIERLKRATEGESD